jgi:preprotein translocase subunit YajC
MINTILWAQQNQPGSGGGDFQILLLSMMGIFFFAWIFLIRPARRQEQERQQMVSGLQKGDEILTTSGIYATVVSISDKKDELVLRSEDTKLRVVRAAIHRNFSAEERAKGPKSDKEAGS